MLRNVFTKTLRDQRRGLSGWGGGVVALVVAMAALWPSIRDIPDLEGFLESYPEAMRELFAVDTITTGVGYLNTELFSIILPAMFVVFAVGRGARLVAGEEEEGTLDSLLATPLSRRRILLEKAAALASCVVVLGGVLWVVTLAVSALFDMGIGPGEAVDGALSMTLLGIEYGFVTLAVGAAVGRRTVAVASGTALAAAGYVVYVTGQLVDAVRPWRMVSPFAQALDDGPMGGGVPVEYLLLVGGAVVAMAVAVPAFDRRDIGT